MTIIKKVLPLSLLIVTVLSCRQGTKESGAAAEGSSHQYCYLQVTQGQNAIADSLYVQLTVHGDSVTGILNWLPAEKDKMTGTLAGTIKDNTVKAIYSYSAEGQLAKEEKIFKIDGDSLRIKNGEMEERNGVWILKNADSVLYNEALGRVECVTK